MDTTEQRHFDTFNEIATHVGLSKEELARKIIDVKNAQCIRNFLPEYRHRYMVSEVDFWTKKSILRWYVEACEFKVENSMDSGGNLRLLFDDCGFYNEGDVFGDR